MRLRVLSKGYYKRILLLSTNFLPNVASSDSTQCCHCVGSWQILVPSPQISYQTPHWLPIQQHSSTQHRLIFTHLK